MSADFTVLTGYCDHCSVIDLLLDPQLLMINYGLANKKSDKTVNSCQKTSSMLYNCC